MRFSFVLYIALYVIVEMIGYQLSLVRWSQITPLMVATAVTDAMLLVAVAVATLLAADLTRPRWQPALAAWARARTAGPEVEWIDEGPLDVRSWRPGPRALPAGPAPRTAPVAYGTYARAGTRPFPEDDGRLL